MSYAAPKNGELVIQKKVNSCFIGTPFEYWLRRMKIDRVIVTGISTDHCVSTSTRMGANLGYDMVVVSDATRAFDRIDPFGKAWPAEDVHRVSLASLSGEFAQVITTDRLIDEN